MDSIVRNRVVGGSVLLLVGALFSPVFLLPDNSESKNLSVQVVKDPTQPVEIAVVKSTPVATLVTKTDIKVETKKPAILELESISTVPVALKKEQVVSSTGFSLDDKQSATLDAVIKKGAWIRVGSFSDRDNADQVALKLKSDKYSVKTELIGVEGVTYKRVLVGPYHDKNKAMKAMEKITTYGHRPTVQK